MESGRGPADHGRHRAGHALWRVARAGRRPLPCRRRLRAISSSAVDRRRGRHLPPRPAVRRHAVRFVAGAAAGDRYVYSIDGSDPRPDPGVAISARRRSRTIPKSSILDAYRWQHQRWTARRHASSIALRAARRHLHVARAPSRPRGSGSPSCATLGITAIELMPIAEFAGSRNWGYDGVCLFAPSRNYGRPDDLRALRRRRARARPRRHPRRRLQPPRARGRLSDAVHPEYLTVRHTTPWGGGVNLDGPGSAPCGASSSTTRCHWMREYRLDGLRLDATHALADDSRPHIVAEATAAVARRRDRGRWRFIAEDHRNLAALVEAPERGGWGLDGVWADDFHHVLRRRLAGDRHGYYQDYTGSDRRADARRCGRAGCSRDSTRRTAARRAAPTRRRCRCTVSSSACRITIRSATGRPAIGCTTRSRRRHGGPPAPCS